MSSKLTCPECGSYSVARSQEEEEFICMDCKHHFPYGEAEEEFKYSLDLVDYGFTEIPDWVCQRTYLKEIDLSAEPYDPFHAPFVNRISEISSGIGQLINLEELDLSSNNVSGIHPEIAKCQNLRHLYLGRNFIKEIPREIGFLKKLVKLNLSDNLIELLPEEIGKLTNLKILNLEDNNLRSLPESIINLTNLEEFRLSGNTDLISPPYNTAMKGLKSIKDWFDKKKQVYSGRQ